MLVSVELALLPQQRYNLMCIYEAVSMIDYDCHNEKLFYLHFAEIIVKTQLKYKVL